MADFFCNVWRYFAVTWCHNLHVTVTKIKKFWIHYDFVGSWGWEHFLPPSGPPTPKKPTQTILGLKAHALVFLITGQIIKQSFYLFYSQISVIFLVSSKSTRCICHVSIILPRTYIQSHTPWPYKDLFHLGLGIIRHIESSMPLVHIPWYAKIVICSFWRNFKIRHPPTIMDAKMY